jgi:hypothetical protein
VGGERGAGVKQILAIFRKDVRHLWPEILVSLLLTVALMLIYPSEWRFPQIQTLTWFDRFRTVARTLQVFGESLIVLVPISWLVLVVRSVHSEGLLGSTQFWVTRPYEWPKLLAAKFTFFFTFIYFPFLLAQSVLLVEGGFNPFHFIVGLLMNLLGASILILPLITLSSLTSSFGKLMLATLGIIGYIAGCAVIYAYLPSTILSGTPSPLGDLLSPVLLFVGCLTCIFLQYARRKTKLTWMLFCGLALLLTAIAFVDPDQWLIWRDYENSNSSQHVGFTYVINPNEQIRAREGDKSGEIEVSVPLRLNGFSDGYLLRPIALRVILQGPNSLKWESRWQSDYRGYLSSYETDSIMRFKIPRKIFDKIQGAPVTLNVLLVFEEAKAYASSEIALANKSFSVADVGICDATADHYARLGSVDGLSCRTAVHEPQLTHVSTYWSDGPCTSAPPTAGQDYAEAWLGDLNPGVNEFGITSVWRNDVNLSNRFTAFSDDHSPVFRHLCPGSQVTFTSYRKLSNGRLSFAIQDLRLPVPESLNFSLMIK